MEIELIVIVLAAFATATMSAVAGFGGGLVLLVVLLQFLDPLDAVPVHGAIQIASNASRARLLREHIDTGIVARHAVLLVPGGLVGLAIADRLPREVGRAAIGVLALVLGWRPSLITPKVGDTMPRSRFVAIGGFQGVINMPLGATGPLISPFFRAATESRQATVATFAASQVVGHVVKVALFGGAGFDFGTHWLVILVGGAAVTLGSMVGTRLLGRVSEVQFGWIFRGVLTVTALRLIAGLVW